METTDCDKLINLLCSTEPSNRALAFQLSHRQEKTYPKFWAFVGDTLRTIFENGVSQAPASLSKYLSKSYIFAFQDFKKASLSKKIKAWKKNIRATDGLVTFYVPTKVRIDVFGANQIVVKSKTIKDISLFSYGSTKYVNFSNCKLLQDLSPLNGLSFFELSLNKCKSIVELPSVEVWLLGVRKCESLNEDSFGNIRIAGEFARITLIDANICNGKALAKCINKGNFSHIDVVLAHIPLLEDEEALHSFLADLDTSRNIHIIGFTREQVKKYKALFPEIDFV